MAAEQESLDLLEPTQDNDDVNMSEELEFESENIDTEQQSEKGNYIHPFWLQPYYIYCMKRHFIYI